MIVKKTDTEEYEVVSQGVNNQRLADPPPLTRHERLLAWAIFHKPTRQAYRKSTGDDIGPALKRYCEWVAANLTGEAS